MGTDAQTHRKTKKNKKKQNEKNRLRDKFR